MRDKSALVCAAPISTTITGPPLLKLIADIKEHPSSSPHPKVNFYHGYHKRMRPIASRKCYHKFAGATAMRYKGKKKSFKEKLFSAGDNFYLSSITEQDSMGYRTKRLETMDLRRELALAIRDKRRMVHSL
jgi:hypothetical protein